MTRCCPIAAIVMAANLLAAVSAATVPDKATPLAIGETFTVESKVLGETRRINVYLPPGYAGSKDLRLPVLYMLDGGVAEDFLHVAGLVQVSVGNETMRPFILVGVENTQRRRDLTGPTTVEADKKIAPVVGKSEAFRKFLRDELMPHLKEKYRTTGEAAIVGESLAGLFVVETFFFEPDLFDTYIAVDPSLWWNDFGLVKEAPTRLLAKPKTQKTLYLASSAEKGIAEETHRLVEALEKAMPEGVTWHHKKMPGEKHSTIFHPAALSAFREVLKPKVAR
jgi:predicted alpha/beta superfamily hydrolase